MIAPELLTGSGYALIVTGTFFEGELVMLAAGMAASAGFLSLPGIIIAGMVGIFLSDTVCFLIGRLAGARLAGWFPKLHARLGPVYRLVEEHDEKMLIFFQFFPGLCTITPVAFGMTRIPIGRFMALDLLGNATWTLVFSLLGYFFEAAVSRYFGFAHPWLVATSYLFLVCGLGAFLWQLHRQSDRLLKA